MQYISKFNLYIFDCDGVILNSNELKIKAMENTLLSLFIDQSQITNCVNYFKRNFGKSRFHHVEHFLDNCIHVEEDGRSGLRSKILEGYSAQCKLLYKTSDITPGLIDFLLTLNGKKYIASGSEQTELRQVLTDKKLSHLFDGIFGSPLPKKEIVSNILNIENSTSALFFGDAFADYEAAMENKIDFVAYLPYSNVKEELKKQSEVSNFIVLNSWSDSK